MARKNAVNSLYGKVETAKTLIGSPVEGGRPQEVHTPDWILEAVREALGGGITLDPCAASDHAAHFAQVNLCQELDPRCDGLALPWCAGWFANPPFGSLGEWMPKAAAEARNGNPGVLLVPFRPHRTWFLASCKGGQIVCLNYNVRFKGHGTAFPGPIVLVSFGCEIPPLGKRETGRLSV